jgi:hypothetical protein
MSCTTAETWGVTLAVTCPPIRLSTLALQLRLKPAPLGWKLVAVKSALSSLE